MSSSNVASVKNIYNNAFYKAEVWLKNIGLGLGKCYVKGLPKSDDVEVIIGIHLRSWPKRPPKPKDGKNQEIDIVVSIKEELKIQKGNICCKKSNVLVTYFNVNKGQKIASPIESIRYDSKSPPDARHPICHAQISENIATKYYLPESFSYTIREISRERVENLRIPSSYINLSGILFILVADHLSDGHWKDFNRICRPTLSNLPILEDCNIIDKIIEEKNLTAQGWYSET